MQGWTAITRQSATKKDEENDEKHIEKLFRKNPKIKESNPDLKPLRSEGKE